MLACPGGAVQKQQIRLRSRIGQLRTVKAVVANACWQRIAQRLSEELTSAFKGMLLARHGIDVIIKATGQWLARRVAIQAGNRRFDVTGQQCAFQQALGIDDKGVPGFAEPLLKALPLTVLERLPQVLDRA